MFYTKYESSPGLEVLDKKDFENQILKTYFFTL